MRENLVTVKLAGGGVAVHKRCDGNTDFNLIETTKE
jgi:hypothetical protein